MRPLSPRRPITGRLGTRHVSNTPFQTQIRLRYIKGLLYAPVGVLAKARFVSVALNLAAPSVTPNHLFLVNYTFTVAEWLACWTHAQKRLGSNRSRDAVG